MPHRVYQDLGQEEAETAANRQRRIELLGDQSNVGLSVWAESGPFVQPSRDLSSLSRRTSVKISPSETTVSSICTASTTELAVGVAIYFGYGYRRSKLAAS